VCPHKELKPAAVPDEIPQPHPNSQKHGAQAQTCALAKEWRAYQTQAKAARL
jgi:hypothetical protein